MKIFTESFFKDSLARIPIYERQRSFSEGDSATFDVFLSYNIADMEIVRGIYFYLKSKGLRVYLDFIVDKDLNRRDVTQETAMRIRKRLENSKSLIYAQSPNAGMSRWMPWELGVVDGNTHKCMIMPVSRDTDSGFVRQEYLKIYPYVKYDELNGRIMVCFDTLIDRERELASYIKS
jgi:hypothetical protein